MFTYIKQKHHATPPQGAAPAADDAKLRAHTATVLSRSLTLLSIPPPPADTLLQRQLQTIIRELVNVKGGRNKHDKSGKHATAQLMCTCADLAGAVAKAGRPRDLHGVAAMVNARVYARWPGGGGLQAFASDVHTVCDLWRAALKRSQSEFAVAMQEAGGGPLADAVATRLVKLLAGGGLFGGVVLLWRARCFPFYFHSLYTYTDKKVANVFIKCT